MGVSVAEMCYFFIHPSVITYTGKKFNGSESIVRRKKCYTIHHAKHGNGTSNK